MSSTYMQLKNNLNYLKLSQMNENLDEMLDYITRNNLSFTEGLIKLTRIEIDHREKNMVKSMVKVLISRLFEQKNERTSQIKLINIIKQLK